MNRRVRLELDRRLDPGRRRVDDRHPGEHVLFVDPIAERRGGGRKLDAGVHAFGLTRLGPVGGDAGPILHEQSHGVGQIQLSLRIRRVESLERRPELAASNT